MNATDLYGTDLADTPSERISVGALAFTLQGAALRHIRLGDRELLRSIAFLARDRDWGTLEPELAELSRRTAPDLEITLRATFRNGGAVLAVTLRITSDGDSLSVTAEGTPQGDFETNRAGFTLLHPAHIAGHPARVTHSDGTRTDSRFPVLIDPWQPFMDITALTHRAAGLSITCALQGDSFEMEDQRQWGDASFKTYNRPLALPWPYILPDGEPVAQSVHLTWQDAPAPAAIRPDPGPADVVFPETALVLTAEDATRLAANPSDIDLVHPQRLLCHVDTSLGGTEAQIAAFATLQKTMPGLTCDLELVCAFDAPPAEELDRVAVHMAQQGFRPDSVLTCPSVDRQSTPPGSDWPACPPLDEVHAAAARAFPDMLRGGGMVSLFTELNRKRPPVEMLDFVGHGLCPIVHAADDVSVMETLEAVPHITRSARAIIGDRGYRIGPATLAMRQNPYGQRTIPNPEGGRTCMTDDDPRHRGAFGAAYLVGLATQLAPAGIAVWTPAALYGPRGLHGPDGPVPLATPLARLASLAGAPVRAAAVSDGIAKLDLGRRSLRANLTPRPNAGLAPYGWEDRPT